MLPTTTAYAIGIGVAVLFCAIYLVRVYIPETKKKAI